MMMAKVMNSETNGLDSPSPTPTPTPTPATPPQPSQHPHHPSLLFSQSQTQRVLNGTCYNCRKRGHWANKCPFKTPSPNANIRSTPSSSSSSIPLSDHPAILCPRCHATCTVRVSGSDKNPGRKYYTCTREKGGKCKFFKWSDDVIDDWDRLPLSKDRPRCNCGAGICMLMLEERKEPNVSPRYYFVCPIEKGHGACNFRLYMDDIWAAIDTVNDDLREGGELGFDNSKKRELEPLMQNPTSFVFAPPETVEETFIEREENELTPSMSTLQDMVPQEGDSRDLIMEKELQVSCLASRAIHHRQAEFWRQISAAGDTSIADPISQFLGLHILGWLGRLAFPPSGCLPEPPSRPFFCCVFPSFDPIFVPKDAAVIHSEGLADGPNSLSNTESDLSQQNLSQGTWCSNDVNLELSGLNNLGNIQQGTDGDGQILEALGKLVLLCQNSLLARLESMNPVDIENVTAVSEHHLGVVSHLLAGYTSFSERVRKFTACASLHSEIETSINMDTSTQELMERYQVEKLRYDNLCLSHAQTVDAIAASDQQLEWLRGEALRLREMLAKIENQVNDGEVENRKLKRRASEMSKDMLESEKKMKGACEELEAAKKVVEQREAARSAAKVALEEARIHLRQ